MGLFHIGSKILEALSPAHFSRCPGVRHTNSKLLLISVHVGKNMQVALYKRINECNIKSESVVGPFNWFYWHDHLLYKYSIAKTCCTALYILYNIH